MMKRVLFCLGLLYSLCITIPVGGQITYMVTTTADSGPGSLRQAILSANSNVSLILDTVQFDITGVGPHSISLSTALPVITDPIYIDGLSQGGASNTAWPATLKIEIEGSQLGVGSEGLVISAGQSIIRGLVINRFDLNGIRFAGSGANRVESCFIGTDITGTQNLGNGNNGIFIQNSSSNTIGGLSYLQRNLISGNGMTAININGAASKYNKVSANYIGTDASGFAALGNGGLSGVWTDLYRAVYLGNGPSHNVIGGPSVGESNVISGNLGHGVYITGLLNRVENNIIGLDATGGGPLGNSFSGVVIYAGTQNTIGGTSAGLGNVIGANGVSGITLTSYSSPAQSNLVYFNTIGQTKGGTPMANGTGLVLSMNAVNNDIVSNTLAYNLGDGVQMTGSGVYHNLLYRNSIYLNGDLGIDLGGDGVSLNDPGDIDTGANELLNYPSIEEANLNSTGKIEVSGNLVGQPNTTYKVDVFASGFCNSNVAGQDYGEGQYHLGQITVSTDALGSANFVAAFAGGINVPGRYITATTTDNNNNTSEFSKCVAIPNWPTLGMGVNGVVRAIAIDSSGTVYIGGDFTMSGNDSLFYLAKWSGYDWENVGSGANAPIHALHFDTAGNLYVGGEFTVVGDTISASRIAMWDGAAWSTFGMGMDSTVLAISTSPNGTLYAGGLFTAADGNSQIKGVARWNTVNWVAMGNVVTQCHTIEVTAGAEVIVGGSIKLTQFGVPENVAKWNGASWSSYSNGVAGTVKAIALGNSNELYIGGQFITSNIINALYFTGFWNGSAWQILGQSVDDHVYALQLDTAGNLYAGGRQFHIRAGQGGNGLGHWNGSTWSPIGGGVWGNEGTVYTLGIHGNYLYVGGSFNQANGVPAANIARFWINFISIPSGLPMISNPSEARKEVLESALQVFPNPFQKEVTIRYSVTEPTYVEVNILNVQGQFIKQLRASNQEPGDYGLIWDGSGAGNGKLGSGIYWVQMRLGNKVITSKLILL